MNKLLRAATLAAFVAGVVGCAGMSSTHTVARRVPHADQDLRRADQPGEAEKAWVAARVADGETALDMQRYIAAMQHVKSMPWHSLASNRTLGGNATEAQLQALGTWQQLGPGNIGGRTRVLRFQPGNPNTMFIAGVDGGLWKSTDAGASWHPINDLSPNLGIVSMAIDPANPLHMWVGTGEGVYNGDSRRGAGIFYSSDGGLNWNQLLSTANSNFYYVNDLVQSPNSANTLYAATRTGVFRSLDAGASWTNVVDTTTPGKNVFGGCFSLVVKPTGPEDIVLAACGTFGGTATFDNFADGAVFRNTDAAGAGTWDSVLSVANQGRTKLAIAPSDPTVMYALVTAGEQTGTTYDDGLLGVWKSIDSGATWTAKVQTVANTADNNFLLLSNPVYGRLADCGFGASNQFFNQGWYDNIIAVDPTNPDRVWAGGIDLWRSDDGGANWGNASFWWFNHDAILDPPTDVHYAHADNHSIVFHPDYDGTTNQQVFATSDGGIFRTDNGAAAVGTNNTATDQNSVCGNANLPDVTWTNLNNGYSVTQFYDGAVYPDNSAYIAGAQDNGTSRGSDASGPDAWEKLQGGDGGYVAVDPDNPLNLYAEFTGFSMVRSTDGGLHFADATSGISDTGSFTNPFVMDSNNSSRLWTGGRRLWRSDDGMATWTRVTNLVLPLQTSGAPRLFTAFGIAPRLPDLVIAATDTGRVYTLAGATTLTPASPLLATSYVLPRGLNGAHVSSLAFDATQTGSSPTARTALIGYSSFNTGGATPQESHVYKTTNGGATWAGIDGMTVTGPSPNGLPDIPVNALLIDPTTANAQRIFVGTDIGVFTTYDGGASWIRENTGFANTAVVKLVMQRNPASNEWELFAFTHGRSVYKTTVIPGEYIFKNGFE